MAKGDILAGTVLWCRAVVTKSKGAEQRIAVDAALQEALDMMRRGKLDGERSAADKKVLKLIDSISDRLAEIEQKALAKARKAKKKQATPGSEPDEGT